MSFYAAKNMKIEISVSVQKKSFLQSFCILQLFLIYYFCKPFTNREIYDRRDWKMRVDLRYAAVSTIMHNNEKQATKHPKCIHILTNAINK